MQEADSFSSQSRPSPWRWLGTLLFWVALPLAAGALLANFLIPKPAVAIIRLNFDIFSVSADLLNEEINLARQTPRVKAAVVLIDSPGGEVVATQTIYLELQDLRRQMPVVGSINGMAASGAFYSAMATDPIYAKPSSTVGNVGVWGYIPSDPGVNDVILASGPFKLSATNREEFQNEIEGIKQEFLATVASQRGARLKISAPDLSQGLAYPGREALSLGLIDALGSQSDAIAKAAELAGIAHYDILDLEVEVMKNFGITGQQSLNNWAGQADPATGERALPPGIYLLYDVRMRRPQ